MHKLIVRSLSGIIYVGLIVGAIFGGAPWFAALMSLFAVMAIIEFENILDGGKPQSWPEVAARILDPLMALAMVNIGVMQLLPDALTIFMLSLIAAYTLLRFTFALYDKGAQAFVKVAWSALSILYIALPLALLNVLYNDRGTDSAMLVLAMFVMIWLNDTGAFCVGSLMGRHKLFERLSPKKSWEGFFGGLAFCVIAGIVCSALLPSLAFGVWGWIAFGIMVCVLSTWGDLFESLLKRTMHIKDSGRLIPGHGGILDRIDSLLFVAVGAMIFYSFI